MAETAMSKRLEIRPGTSPLKSMSIHSILRPSVDGLDQLHVEARALAVLHVFHRREGGVGGHAQRLALGLCSASETEESKD
jgi:hypothetical protein